MVATFTTLPPPPPLRCQTVAGSGRIGASDGPSEVATFSFPYAVLPLPDSSALVSDSNNDTVRHISVDARGLFTVRRVGARGFTWMRPRGLAQLPDGGVLVCDSGHNRVRLLGADGSVSVFAGSGRRGCVDGPAASAAFDNPSGVCVCADGSVLVADTGNNCIRVITFGPTSAGGGNKRVVSTLAGSGRAGCTDGLAAAASFDKPSSVLALGSPRDLGDGESVVYVTDTANHCIRTISAGITSRGSELHVSTLCGKPGLAGHADGSFAECLFSSPTGLSILPDGTLAIADAGNNCVRRLAVEARIASTLAGSSERMWGLVDGPSADARFNTPKGIGVSPTGDVWVADTQNHCVRLLREDVHAIAAAADTETRRLASQLYLPSPSSKAAWDGRGRRTSGSSADEFAERAMQLVERAEPVDIAEPSESFATDAFRAEAQLFERAPLKSKASGGDSRGGWTYTGAASVTLKRAAHRTATLRVQVHGAASAELSVLRPGQLRLRDTAFVVCSRDESSESGFHGFGVNELGLRFSTTTAAASLLAACEAMVVGADAGPLPTDGEAMMATRMPRPSSASTADTPLRAAAPSSARRQSGASKPVSAIPTLRRPRPGAPSAADDAPVEERLHQAEQDVLRLSARLAERDVEAGKMLKRLEQAQAQVRSRDAKVAELTRRLGLMSQRS